MGRRIFSFATSSVAVFVLAWAAVLSVPELRQVLQRQADGTGDWGYGSISRRFVPLAPIARALEKEPPTFQELAARYPDDIGVQLLAKEDELLQRDFFSASDPDQSPRIIRAYDATIARYPRQAWLLANRLRFATNLHPLQLRTIHDNIPPGLRRVKLLPHRKARLLDITRSSITIAQQGRELEPDNCYFDWVLASCLFALDRDEEAMQVLHEGARKPLYNEHFAEDVRARVRVQQLMRTPIYEEKIAALAALTIGDSQDFLQTARIAVAKGASKERAGDDAGALQVYGDIATLGARVRDADFATYFAGIFCTLAQTSAWQKGQAWTPQERQGFVKLGGRTADNSCALAAAKFAPYAEAHGRSDLARQARQDSEINQRLRKQSSVFFNNYALGIPIPVLEGSIKWNWLCAALMSQLQTTIALWLALRIVLLRVRFNRRARDTPHMSTHARREKENRPGTTDVASVVLWSSCVIAVLLFVAARARSEQQPFSDDDAGQWTLTLLSIFLTLAPVALCGLYIGSASWWRNRRKLRAKRAQNETFAERPKTIVQPSSWRRDAKRGASLFVSLLLLIVVVGSWMIFYDNDLSSESVRGFQGEDFAWPLIASAAAFFWLLVKWRWSDVTARVGIVRNLRWYASSLGVLIALSSVTYAAFAFASLPARQLADARVDDCTGRGEMALIRETQLPAP